MRQFRTRIDPRITQVKPSQIHAYMTAHGWNQQPYPRPELWVFTKPKTFEEGTLTLTAGSSADIDGYFPVLDDLIHALTVWEDSYYTEILSEMLSYPAVPTTTNGANGEVEPAVPKRRAPRREAEK